jgi:hypothetical protein
VKRHFVLVAIVLLLAACAPAQSIVDEKPVDIQASLPAATSSPTATTLPTAVSSPTATSNPCTDLGWTDITKYLADFDYQVGAGTFQGVIVSEWLKTVTGIKDNIANVTIDACTEPARKLVVSSLDNRITVQQMLYTGKFSDPAAITDGLMQANQMMRDAQAELNAFGLQVVLSTATPVATP